uniref:general stress protein n=1 Tax=Caulobacter sp. S45 TaxID=1641861 RepID=UPI0035304913
MQTVTGLFDDYTDAQAAVRELEAAGVPHRDISIVGNNAKGEHDHLGAARAHEAGEDAGKGAGLGATVGGVGGLLAGLGLLAIPGLGPVVAAGWLASTVVGAGVGAVVG